MSGATLIVAAGLWRLERGINGLRPEEAPAATPTATRDTPTPTKESAAPPCRTPSGPGWSAVEQRSLQAAFVRFPKGCERRFEQIAAAVGTRTERECLDRCHELAAAHARVPPEGGDEVRSPTQQRRAERRSRLVSAHAAAAWF